MRNAVLNALKVARNRGQTILIEPEETGFKFTVSEMRDNKRLENQYVLDWRDAHLLVGRDLYLSKIIEELSLKLHRAEIVSE